MEIIKSQIFSNIYSTFFLLHRAFLYRNDINSLDYILNLILDAMKMFILRYWFNTGFQVTRLRKAFVNSRFTPSE